MVGLSYRGPARGHRRLYQSVSRAAEGRMIVQWNYDRLWLFELTHEHRMPTADAINLYVGLAERNPNSFQQSVDDRVQGWRQGR